MEKIDPIEYWRKIHSSIIQHKNHINSYSTNRTLTVELTSFADQWILFRSWQEVKNRVGSNMKNRQTKITNLSWKD